MASTDRNRFAWWILALLVVTCAHSASAQNFYWEDIGYNDLMDRLDGATPDGTGVNVTIVEAAVNQEGTKFLPKQTHFGGTLMERSPNGEDSNHASETARNYFGFESIAPAVPNVDAYEANHYLFDGFLKTFSVQAPTLAWGRIHNNSWLATGVDPNVAIDINRRLDYAIDQGTAFDSTNSQVVTGFTSIAAVTSSLSTFPDLLGNSYNSIVVGVSDGNSSMIGTTLEGVGRSKPDLVAPGEWEPISSSTTPSRATARVSGAAALLMDTILETGATDAERPEIVKSLLMAGASKEGTPGWAHTDTQPLDLRWGAGELNINNSHRILEAGQQEASLISSVSNVGWDLNSINGGDSDFYFFEVEANRPSEGLSAILTWHRHIELTPGAGINPATLDPSLADLNLRLHSADGSLTLGSELERSISTIDNVEHVYLPSLAAGWYALEVEAIEDLALPAIETWQYGLAWDSMPGYLPGDVNGDGFVDGLDANILGSNWLMTGATHEEGDLNGDGVVNGLDANEVTTYWNLAPPATAIPEPTALGLMIVSAVWCAVSRRSRR